MRNAADFFVDLQKVFGRHMYAGHGIGVGYGWEGVLGVLWEIIFSGSE